MHFVPNNSAGSAQLTHEFLPFTSPPAVAWVDLKTINLAAICTPADYNTRPLDTIYSNFIDALPVVGPRSSFFRISYYH